MFRTAIGLLLNSSIMEELSTMCQGLCRRKVRMSGLCKVEMSAFMGGRGPHGNGANDLESTRTGPYESVA